MHGARLNVVHIVASLDVGGLERVVYDLCRRTDRERFTLRVICLDMPGAWAHRFEDNGIPVDCVPQTRHRSIGRMLRLAKRLRALRTDVVHTHNVKAHLHGALAARLARVPVIVSTKHGRNFPASRLSRMANQLACAVCSDLVGVSKDCAAIWHAVEGARLDKVSVVTNGVDLRAFPRTERRSNEGMRAVSVARLCDVKDPVTLLRATRHVVEREPGFRLDLAGDGPLRRAVEQTIGALHLTNVVRVLGNVDDVASVLAGANFFVLSSTSEGVSLTLLEAMAQRLPVVATSVGGTPEVVAHGDTGLLVPPRSPEALADAMLWMVRNPRAREAMGDRGRRRVEEHFDLDKTVDAYQRLYVRALHAPGHGEPDRVSRPAAA